MRRTLCRRSHWQYLVLDEAHKLLTAREGMCERLGQLPAASRLLLTATPMHSSLWELWRLLNFVHHDLFPSAEAFERAFANARLDVAVPPEEQRELEATDDDTPVTQLAELLGAFVLRRSAPIG